MKHITHDRDAKSRDLSTRTSGETCGSIPPRARRATDSNHPPHAEELFRLAQKISATREVRGRTFSATIFGEPGWDMLLALYRAAGTGHRMTVTHMCDASEVPATTALRWIENLVQLGMVYRRDNPLDARVVFIEMTPDTYRTIEGYLMEVWVKFYSPE